MTSGFLLHTSPQCKYRIFSWILCRKKRTYPHPKKNWVEDFNILHSKSARSSNLSHSLTRSSLSLDRTDAPAHTKSSWIFDIYMEETCEGGIHWSSGTPISSDLMMILKKWTAGIMPVLHARNKRSDNPPCIFNSRPVTKNKMILSDRIHNQPIRLNFTMIATTLVFKSH